ncbi:winged helix-turn-helix domain-containing protein [Microbacterium sp. BK668]|uniref:winged helix-turn-helix domain-containing protein n=1 Tax=Microbacterium sp. BK668 TaxID=2512118 RepID=UPI0010EDFC5B|nr:winged helix-turn-helix domain-containing protein [Microbacterium sp. BK668]TDN91188.1 helix-turn-helix protein [Microbacterium sp. BK668]
MSDQERIELRPGDPDAEARMRALSSPLRLRILRLCAFESRTNKELAGLLGVNPGTMLHHVRTLLNTGYLAAEPDRAGAQGAREVPYRATGLSWRTSMPGGSYILVETFLQQIESVRDEDLDTTWLGLKLNDEHREELQNRLMLLVNEFKERGPDPDGDTYSLFTAFHPDDNPPGPAQPPQSSAQPPQSSAQPPQSSGQASGPEEPAG